MWQVWGGSWVESDYKETGTEQGHLLWGVSSKVLQVILRSEEQHLEFGRPDGEIWKSPSSEPESQLHKEDWELATQSAGVELDREPDWLDWTTSPTTHISDPSWNCLQLSENTSLGWNCQELPKPFQSWPCIQPTLRLQERNQLAREALLYQNAITCW